ncbi:MAG: sugar phosphate isomerase/epimerase family protein [Planctomycetota bacterium]|jgi:sugar phosphate isomerase/epimerase
MLRSLDRREFLTKTVGGATGLALFGTGVCAAEAEEPLFRVSLAQWSLHKRLQGRAEPKLDPLNFAMTARDLGIEAIEYVNSFFKDRARDEDYLKDMKTRAEGEGVKSLLIMCDGEGALGDPDKAAREQAVMNHHRWVEAARFLDCHAIRVNAQSKGSPEEQQKLAADGLRSLCEFAKDMEISVIVENHGGISSNAAWLAGVMQLVDHPSCGTLPDFGNFRIREGEIYDKYKGVEELMPYAKAVSAKSYEFDVDGNETTIDYLRMMGIVVDAGYRGYVGIEYEGSTLGEEKGILSTKALLEKVRAELAAR